MPGCALRWLGPRLHWSWHVRVWPWAVPRPVMWSVVPPCVPLTVEDRCRAWELADELGL